MQKEFYLKNCFLGGKYNKFFLWIEKSFGARISLDGYARLFHFRLLLRIILTDTKLSSHFNIKDDTNKQHTHYLVYFGRCLSTTCTDSYIGGTDRDIPKDTVDHTDRDTKMHFIRHHL